MRISRDQTICGAPAFDLRAAFKRLSSGWDAIHLGAQLGVPASDAVSILERLVGDGYVEPAFLVEDRQLYRLTIKGGALALASALKPINRRKADEIVAGVIQRAKEVNADHRELYRVSRLWAFGSYLTEVEELGDVDIAFELARNDNDWPARPEGELAYTQATAPMSWRRGFFESLAWPQEAVLRRLKARRRHLSLHPSTDEVLASVEMRQIFPT